MSLDLDTLEADGCEVYLSLVEKYHPDQLEEAQQDFMWFRFHGERIKIAEVHRVTKAIWNGMVLITDDDGTRYLVAENEKEGLGFLFFLERDHDSYRTVDYFDEDRPECVYDRIGFKPSKVWRLPDNITARHVGEEDGYYSEEFEIGLSARLFLDHIKAKSGVEGVIEQGKRGGAFIRWTTPMDAGQRYVLHQYLVAWINMQTTP